jgi:hypothetical protein
VATARAGDVVVHWRGITPEEPGRVSVEWPQTASRVEDVAAESIEQQLEAARTVGHYSPHGGGPVFLADSWMAIFFIVSRVAEGAGLPFSFEGAMEPGPGPATDPRVIY